MTKVIRRLRVAAKAAALASTFCLIASVGFAQQQLPGVSTPASQAKPGDVRVIASNGLRTPLEAIRPQVQRAIGKPLLIEYGSSRSLQPTIEGGQPYEVTILTRELVDELAGKGKVVPGSRVDLASAPVGVAATSGGAKLNISTPEGLKQALLGAKVIKYAGIGAARPTVNNVFAKLGIADAVKSKSDESSSSQDATNAKLSGADYAIVLTLASELTPIPGWTYLGLVPDQLQVPVVMSAGVGPAGDKAAAATLIKFLQGPTMDPALKTNRMSRDIPPPVQVAQAAPPPAPPAPPRLTTRAIVEGKVYWVEGGGGNSGIIIGNEGVTVIDAKTTPEAARVLIAEVAKLTPKPITHLVITHSDGDHFNGSAAFPDSVKIVGHVNLKQEIIMVPLYAAVEVDGGRCIPPQDRLPNMVLNKPKTRATINGVAMEFHHYGPAHTSGDIVVYLPAEKIAFTGDILTTTVLVHPEKMGSFEGWFKNANGLLALPATQYVAGHSATILSKADVRAKMAGYQATKDKVDALVREGKTLAEVKVAMNDPPKDPSGCRGIPYPSLGWVEFHEETSRLNAMR